MKFQNPIYPKTKLHSFSLAVTIFFFFLIIVVDTILSVSNNNYIDAISMSSLGVLYIAQFFLQPLEKKKTIFPMIVFLLTTAALIFMSIKRHHTEGSYFYLFPAAIGYLSSTLTVSYKIRFRFFYFIVFSIATILIIQYFIYPSAGETILGTLLFTFRFISSFIFMALLITIFSLSKTSNKDLSNKINFHDAIYQSYPDAFIIFDKETLEIKDYNDSLVKLFELPDTIDFQDLYITQLMMRYLAEDSPNLELLMNKIPDEWSGEATFLTFTKKRFYTLVKSYLFINNEMPYLFLSIRNISELNKAKEDLIEYKEKMEKASKAKARFLSNMSHELRTPLNGIIGTSNLILSENNLQESIKKHISVLHYSSEHMLGIINDILDFSKIDAGKLELNRHVFNMKESLDKLTKSFANEYDNKNIELLFSHDPRIASINVLSDEVKLRQVLANLLSNALKFTISGQVILNVSIDDLTEKSIIVSFEVKDTGIGISKEKHEEIFLDFVQVNDNDLRRFDGTGLGLTISEKLVDTFGGKLQVESELEKGSRFYFTIKFEMAPVINKPRVEIKNNGAIPDIRGIRVLIVEDNEINAGILRSFLLKWEVRIKEARNGIQAMELLKYHKFDLILMDLEMPEMNGYMAVKKIRETDTEIPVIAFTAALLENMDSLITESGFNDYVLKPFRPADLKKKIEYYVPHRKIEYI